MELIESFKNTQTGNIKDIPSNQLFPLIIWNSSNIKNIPVCNFINKHFFYVKPEILKGLLSLAVDKKQRFMRYPKAAKKDIDKKIELIKPYVMKIYGWSSKVFEMQKHLITEDFIIELNMLCGFNKKECKTLGIGFAEFKVEKPKSVRQRSLF